MRLSGGERARTSLGGRSRFVTLGEVLFCPDCRVELRLCHTTSDKGGKGMSVRQNWSAKLGERWPSFGGEELVPAKASEGSAWWRHVVGSAWRVNFM